MFSYEKVICKTLVLVAKNWQFVHFNKMMHCRNSVSLYRKVSIVFCWQDWCQLKIQLLLKADKLMVKVSFIATMSRMEII